MTFIIHTSSDRLLLRLKKIETDRKHELENLGQNLYYKIDVSSVEYNQTIALITTIHVMKIIQKMLMTRCRHVRYLF